MLNNETPNSVQIFEIVEVETSSTDNWLVRGLAYQDIAAGDVLFASIPGRQDELAYFEVKGITTYRRQVLRLSAGYTGELLIISKEGNLLRNVRHLLGKVN
jgi:hypothetical protein